MRRPRFEDEGASARTVQRRRNDDLAFLERMKTAGAAELATMWKQHQHASTPPWKPIAIARALRRLSGDLLLPGWVCPACRGFNGEAKERRDACRACDFVWPEGVRGDV